ncbi:MAG: PAS domain S-box protein [Pyrinomonadaceae bacterium]|nr:PAS domain S-box protein [Phycisphaerales bacterium]
MSVERLPSRSRATAPVYLLICLGTVLSAVLLAVFTQSTYQAASRLEKLTIFLQSAASIDADLALAHRRHHEQDSTFLTTDPLATLPSGSVAVPDLHLDPSLPMLQRVEGMPPHLAEVNDLLSQMEHFAFQVQAWRAEYLLRHERLRESRQQSIKQSELIRDALLCIPGKHGLHDGGQSDEIAGEIIESVAAPAQTASSKVATDCLLIELLDNSVALEAMMDAKDRDTLRDIAANRVVPILSRLRATARSQARVDPDFGAAHTACEDLAIVILGKEAAALPGFVTIQGLKSGLIAECSLRLESLGEREQFVQAAHQLTLEFEDHRLHITNLADYEASSQRAAIRDSLFASIRRCIVAGAIACVIFAGVGWRVVRTIRRYAERIESITIQVTAAKDRADTALREVEALRSTLDEHAIVSAADPSGRIIYANDLFCRLSGYTREELIGSDHSVVNSDNHPTPQWTEMWETISGGATWHGQVCNKAKDGSLYWVEATIAPFKNVAGSIEKYVSIRTDITERKRMEDTVRESEQRLRAVIDAEPECVLVLDAARAILEMNPAGLAMLEADSINQVRELTLNHFVMPAYHAAFEAVHARVMGGGTSELVFEITGRKGTHRWLETNVVPLRSTSGEVVAMLSVTRDITDRRQMEESLRVSAERFQCICKATTDSIWDWDLIKATIWWNEGFSTMFGYPPEEIGSGPESWTGRIHPDDLKRVSDGVHSVLNGTGHTWTDEYRFRRRDGQYADIFDRGFVIRDATGKPVRMTGAMQDITERKGAEENLRHLSQVQDEMGRVARVGGWELNVLTSRVMWTREIYGIFELPESFSPTLESSLSFFPEKSRQIVARHIQHTIDTGDPFDYTVPFTTATGRNLWVRGMGKAERRDGGTVHLYGAFLDVTESYEASEELISARDAAQVASRAKSEFLANMSHEIRTPLTAIMGFADILREDGNLSGAPPQRLQAIDSINNAGRHLLTVINDILDLSKIEADKMTVERIDTPLVRLLREVESLMRPRAIGKGVMLTALLTSPIPEHVVSDPTRLRQILMNLTGNAVKFTEAGSVTIAVGVEHTAAEDRLVIDVEDTGSGMTPQQSSCLFLPFGQADGTVTRKHGGTGLGLTISRRLAGLMGGDVKLLRTEPGKGSCFRLLLPLEPIEGSAMIARLDSVQDSIAPQPAVATALLSGRILLAEDGADNQRLIAFHLRKAGAIVDIAVNGRIALEMLDCAAEAQQPYNLLLTDMQMPEMDGYTLASILRQRGSTLAIVALTAHAMAEDRTRCIDAGCDDYATKPIDKAALIETCAAWMGRTGGIKILRAAA